MDKRIEKLKNWGCILDKPLFDRFVNDDDFYISCLEEIPQENSFLKLKQALENNKTEEAFGYAHLLKGVLSNLGLTPMLNLVCEIVEPLRIGNSDNLIQKADQLIELKNELTDILNDK